MRLIDWMIIFYFVGIIALTAKLSMFIDNLANATPPYGDESLFFFMLVFLTFSLLILLLTAPLIKIMKIDFTKLFETEHHIEKSLKIVAIRENNKIQRNFFLLENDNNYFYRYESENGFKNGKINKFDKDLIVIEDSNLKNDGIINYNKEIYNPKKEYIFISQVFLYFLFGHVRPSIEIRVPPKSIDWTINELQ